MPPDTTEPRVETAEAAVLSLVFLIGAVALEAYLLALAGIHHLATVGAAALVTVGLGALAWRRWRPSFARSSWRSLLPVLPAVGVVLVMSFPGFHYATGDKDPGIYVLHATSIADTGHLRIPTTPLQRSGALTESDVPGSQWRGFQFSQAGTDVLPSFYHLWPALLAVGFEAVGFRAISLMVPLLALLSTLALYFLARRLAGTWAAVAASLLLATNMMQVWQSRYPTSEILAQLLFVGAALGVVLALTTHWRGAAFAAGLLFTTGFVARGEGVAMVLLVGAGLALAAAWGGLEGEVRWAALGMALPLPIAYLQAYHVAILYTRANNVPGWKSVTAVLVLEAGAALAFVRVAVLRTWLHRVAGWFRAGDGDAAPWLKWSIAAAIVVLGVFGVFRPQLGNVMFRYNGSIIRSYDERSLWRLAMYFTWPGIALAVAGAVLIVLGRWRREVVAVAAVVMVFTVLFLHHAVNSPQMMWWGRRFVPVVVPGLVLLAGIAVATVIGHVRRNGPFYVVALLVVVGVIAVQASYSWTLHGHDEKAGSYGVVTTIGDIAGGTRSTFLWQRGPCCAAAPLLFGSSLWIFTGNDSALLPADVTNWDAYETKVVAAVPGQPLYVLLDPSTPPPPSTSITYTKVKEVSGALSVWIESNTTRPKSAIPFPFDVVVYRVTAR